MKKKITSVTLALITLITTPAFIVSYQTGIAGYTSSPGETGCNSCHGGGNSAASGTTIFATPSFTNNEYVPGTNYTITINVAASGFNAFGFGCEILNAGNANAGTMHAQGSGVKFLNSGSRKNAVHTTPKSGTGGTSFTFEWTAPSNNDNATIYVGANAVNGNSSTSGDFPMTPVSLALTPQPEIDPVGIKENRLTTLSQLSVYPNPAGSLTNISFKLSSAQVVTIELISLTGGLVKELSDKEQPAGVHSQILELQDIPSGLYFIKVSVNGKKTAQKLISRL